MHQYPSNLLIMQKLSTPTVNQVFSYVLDHYPNAKTSSLLVLQYSAATSTKLDVTMKVDIPLGNYTSPTIQPNLNP